MPHFLYVVKPPRENFPETITDGESKIISEHFNYIKELFEKNVVYFVGRTSGGDFGIIVFKCETLEKAKEISSNDPAVKKGIFSAETYPFNLVMYGTPGKE